MRIVYIGANSGTSKHRANALSRLGHEVVVLSPYSFLPRTRIVDKWIFETGGLLLEKFIHDCVIHAMGGHRYDIAWVDGGDLIGPSLVDDLKRRCCKVINYNVDDPFGSQYYRRWRLYLKAISHYDLVVVVRECNVDEAIREGATSVILVRFSADEIVHAPLRLNENELRVWSSDVVFVGTWMPERGPFMTELLSYGVPLTIFGDRWYKAREWPKLRHCWRGPNLSDADYPKAITAAKLCLGLLSKGNRDLHTTRSLEIPYLGGLFCAERTCEHLMLYAEGEEAVFWKDAGECAQKCFCLIADDELRQRIAERGRERCLKNGWTNERVLAAILDRAAVQYRSETVSAVFV